MSGLPTASGNVIRVRATVIKVVEVPYLRAQGKIGQQEYVEALPVK